MECARELVSRVVLDRVRNGEAVAVLTRQKSGWDLPACPSNGFVEAPSQNVSLTRDWPGGKAILHHLLGTDVADAVIHQPKMKHKVDVVL